MKGLIGALNQEKPLDCEPSCGLSFQALLLGLCSGVWREAVIGQSTGAVPSPSQGRVSSQPATSTCRIFITIHQRNYKYNTHSESVETHCSRCKRWNLIYRWGKLSKNLYKSLYIFLYFPINMYFVCRYKHESTVPSTLILMFWFYLHIENETKKN